MMSYLDGEEKVIQIYKWLNTAGVVINLEKTKYMKVSRIAGARRKLVISDIHFEDCIW